MRLAILSALVSLGFGSTANAQYIYGPRPAPTVSFGFSYNSGFGGYSYGYNSFYAPRPVYVVAPVYGPPRCNHGFPPPYVAPYPAYPYGRPYWR